MTGPDWCRRILLPFVATRAGLLLVGVLALGLVGSVRDRMPGNLVAHSPTAPALEIWARWDSEWFLLIAGGGYRADSALAGHSVGYRVEDTAGFFPLYPMLIRLLSAAGLPPVAAGILVSNVCLLLALTLLHRIGNEVADETSASATIWILLSFPPSLFLSAVYSESLALALSLAAFLAARRRQWGRVAWLGFLGSLARPTGVLVAPALAWDVHERRGGWRGWLSLGGFAAGTAAFSAYCARQFGDPLAWAHRQERWRGGFSGPWRAFQRFWESSPHWHGAHDSILELTFATLFLTALPFVIRKFPRSWGTHALLTVLVPLGSTLWSFGRLTLMAFPTFVWIGTVVRERREMLLAILAVGLLLEGFLMALFACGWWAG